MRTNFGKSILYCLLAFHLMCCLELIAFGDALKQTCACDFNLNECDVNCCCDTLCTSSDLAVFQCSNLNNQSTIFKWCISSDLLYTQNTNFVVNTTGGNTCIQVNQTLLLASYQALTANSALSSYTIAQIVNFSVPLIEDMAPLYSLGFNISTAKFTDADQVWLVQANATTGSAQLDYITLPVRLPSGAIADQPVNYFRNVSTRLSVSSTDIMSVCISTGANTAALSTLSLTYFLPKTNFQLLTKPRSLVDCLNNLSANSQTPQLIYNASCLSAALTSIQLNSCTYGSGSVSTNCSSDLAKLLIPTNVSSTCSNLVKSVRYSFAYDQSTSLASQALIDVVFFDQDLTNMASQVVWEQKFESIFTSVPLSSLSSSSVPIKAGYEIGDSIRTSSSANPSFNTNNFAYVKPAVDGKCLMTNGASLRDTISFGTNTMTECIYEIQANVTPTSDFCTKLQNDIDSIVIGSSNANQRPYLFLPFPDPSKAGPKTIVYGVNSNSMPKVNSNGLDGLCSGVRTGLSIQIATALNGNVDYPSRTVEYIGYDWTRTVDVNTQCMNQKCSNVNANTLRLHLSTSVVFVDTSQLNSAPFVGNTLETLRRRLGDFFFPLSTDKNY